MTITRRTLYPVALIIFSAFLPAPPARAAGVVSVCDEFHFVQALVGGGSVTFSCTGVITLTLFAGVLEPGKTTLIDGGGAVTISGQILLQGAGTELDLSNITMQGSFNGAIRNEGNVVRVSRTKFANNGNNTRDGGSAGGAITNVMGGNLFVSDCYFLLNGGNFGGAIYNENSSMEVVDSTFFLNSAASKGGAIYSTAGLVNIANSTLTDNGSVAGVGGNIYFEMIGPPAPNAGISVIEGSTLNAGRAGPGLAGNLSVAAPPGSLQVVNTIMANPGGPLAPLAVNCGGSQIDGGGNLKWPASSSSACVGTVGDPNLAALANYGGTTLTMALMPGSAAIDKGYDAGCTKTDQRHVLRPQGPHCDIGAYEDIPSLIETLGQLGGNLGNFTPALPRAVAGRLTQQVISPLLRSLDPALWLADGNHLNPQRGEQVFDLHQIIVNNLAELIVDKTQLDYIDNLLIADRSLAAAAMSAANCTVAGVAAPPNGKCAQAAAQLALGDAGAAAGNYSDAIDHYKSAWGDGVSVTSHN